MPMYTKPIPYEEFIDMIGGEPTEEDLKENKKILERRLKDSACDIEQEGNCSHESEQGCLGCVHHVNEDELKNMTE